MKQIKFSVFPIVLVLFCLIFGSVWADSVVVTDILGREVTVESPLTLGIVAGKKTGTISELPFMFTDALSKIVSPKGGQDKGAFVSLLNSTAPELTDFSVEAVAALKPDVIFLKSYTREDAGIAYEETGIPVVYLSLETVEDYQTDVDNVGKIMGQPERAKEILDYYAGIVENVKAKVAPVTEKKRVLLVQYAEADGAYALKVAPNGWLQTAIVEMAGGEPVWSDIGLNAKKWTDVNFEQIAAWDPDVILVVNYFDDPKASVEKLNGEEGWKLLRAVKEEQVFPFGKDTLSWDSASPRWGLGLLWTAKALYPELTEDINLENEMDRFYTWFGLSEDIIQTKLIDAFLAEPVKAN